VPGIGTFSGQCAVVSQGFGVADGISKNLKWTICGITNMLKRWHHCVICSHNE